MSPFKKILPFNALRPEQLGQVICPNLTYLSIMDLCDDPDALDGGEAALRALCDAQGREWDWDWWDNNERTELVEALWNLVDHGVYIVRQTTSFPPALPAFHQVDGQWQVTPRGAPDEPCPRPLRPQTRNIPTARTRTQRMAIAQSTADP